MKDFFAQVYNWIYLQTGAFDEIIYSLPVLFLIGVVYIFLRKKHINKISCGKFKQLSKEILLNEMVTLLFFLWCVLVFFMTLLPSGFWQTLWGLCIFGTEIIGEINPPEFSGWNFMPEVVYYLSRGHLDWFIASAKYILPDFIENIVLFMPFGLALPILNKKFTMLKTVLAGFLVSFAIEFVQSFIGRSGDINDLLCNTLGALIGYSIFILLKKLFPRFIEKCKTSANDIISIQ